MPHSPRRLDPRAFGARPSPPPSNTSQIRPCPRELSRRICRDFSAININLILL